MDIVTGVSHEASERARATPAETLVICTGILCAVSGILLPMCSIDVYYYALIPLRLIMPACLTIGGLLLVFFGVRSKHRNTGFPFWKDLLIWLAVNLVYLLVIYVTPLPSLYAGSVDTGFPLVRDLRTAYRLTMTTTDETETVFGFCTPHAYNLRFEWDDFGWTKKFWAIELENGRSIPVNNLYSTGLYTVTYRKADDLPVSVVPYDPNCGENVIVSNTLKDYYRELGADESAFSEQEQRFWDHMPDIYVIYTTELSHRFPVTELRITSGGKTVKTVRLKEEDDHIFTEISRDKDMEYYSAQLYAIYPGNNYHEFALPVSNRVDFEFSQEDEP